MKDQATLLHHMLRGDLDADALALAWNVPKERLYFYIEAVKGHIREAVEKNYDVSSVLFPSDTFTSLVNEFYRRYPAEHYELNRCASAYRAFIDAMYTQNRFGISNFICELTQLEWAEWEVYATREEIRQPKPDQGFVFNPTLQTLMFSYPVGTFVRAWRHNDGVNTLGEPQPSDETVFVFRHPISLHACTMVASPRMLFVLKMVHDVMTPGDAARCANISTKTVLDLLQEAVDDGWLLCSDTF